MVTFPWLCSKAHVFVLHPCTRDSSRRSDQPKRRTFSLCYYFFEKKIKLTHGDYVDYFEAHLMSPTILSQINCSGVQTEDCYGSGTRVSVLHVGSAILNQEGKKKQI